MHERSCLGHDIFFCSVQVSYLLHFLPYGIESFIVRCVRKYRQPICLSSSRSSGVKSKVVKLKTMYDSRQRVVLEGAEPAVVASLLKLFLRELPHPVLTLALMPRFEEYAAFKDPAKRLAGFKALVEQLPEANRCLLEWIFCHMGKYGTCAYFR